MPLLSSTRIESKVNDDTKTSDLDVVKLAPKVYKWELVWRNIFGMILLHIAAIIGVYMTLLGYGQTKTLIWYYFLTYVGAIGVTMGAHRLWCHRCYKAVWPLRVFLAIGQTIAGQNDLFEWCRDHRVHHKFSETDGDPHNSNRGFFFAHMGWLLIRKHPDVFTKGKTVDMSDLWADPVIRFQRRFYYPLLAIFWAAIPVFVPVYYWNESLLFSGFFNMARYVAMLHQTWLVNSAAHLWGHRPYDQKLKPVEQPIVVWLTTGEGYHNYHHAFPYDYSASEYGWRDNFNPATLIIDFAAKMGWAYDLKKPPQEVIDRRKERTGDGYDNKLKNGKYYKDMFYGNLFNTWPLWLFPILRYFFAIEDTSLPF